MSAQTENDGTQLMWRYVAPCATDKYSQLEINKKECDEVWGIAKGEVDSDDSLLRKLFPTVVRTIETMAGVGNNPWAIANVRTYWRQYHSGMTPVQKCQIESLSPREVLELDDDKVCTEKKPQMVNFRDGQKAFNVYNLNLVPDEFVYVHAGVVVEKEQSP